MKKRKELDALLMNGKKSRPKRSKDGHELLQNMDSESNSSELDEFIVQTRKQTTRRRKGVLCSICIRLLVFILVVGCITVTVGVMWMHFELKNDLDDLRKQLTKVQSMVKDSQTESSTMADRNNNMFYSRIPSLTTSVGLLNESISSLNESIANLRVNIQSLQDSATAHNDHEAKNLEDVNQLKLKLKSLKIDAAANQSSLSTLIGTLKTNLSGLQAQVTELSQRQSNTPATSQPAAGLPVSDEAVQSLQKSINSLDSSFLALNLTVFDLSTEVATLRASYASGAPIPPLSDGASNRTDTLDKLQQNVDYLMGVVQRELSSEEPTGVTPGDATMGSWQAQVDGRVGILENQVKDMILGKTYQVFRDKVEGNLTSLTNDHQAVMTRIEEDESALTGVTTRLGDLELRVVALEDANTLLPSVASFTPNQTDIAPGAGPATEIEQPTSPSEEGALPQEEELMPPTAPPDQGGGGAVELADQVTLIATNEVTDLTTEGPNIGPSGTQNPADAPLTTAAVVENMAPGGEPPNGEMPPTNGSLTEDAMGKEPTDGGKSVNNPGSQSSLNGTTSEPELDTQLSLLTGAANVSRTMRSTSTDSRTTDDLISTGMVSTDSAETTLSGITTKRLETTKGPPLPVLRINRVTSRKALTSSFHVWDRNNDGELTYHEFSQISNFHRRPPPQADFLAYDEDGDSQLTEKEMAAAMHL